MNKLVLFIGLWWQVPSVGTLMPGYQMVGLCGLAVALVAAAVSPVPLRDRWKWLLAPFLITVLILAYGAAFQFEGGPAEAAPWRVNVLLLLLSLHAPATLALVIYFRRNLLVPLGLAVFQAWYSYCAFIMSGMSVTNNWL